MSGVASVLIGGGFLTLWLTLGGIMWYFHVETREAVRMAELAAERLESEHMKGLADRATVERKLRTQFPGVPKFVWGIAAGYGIDVAKLADGDPGEFAKALEAAKKLGFDPAKFGVKSNGSTDGGDAGSEEAAYV
jgi:hypothetical protein